MPLFDALPVELLLQIAASLPPASLASLALTTKSLKALLETKCKAFGMDDDTLQIFLNYLLRDLPANWAWCNEGMKIHPCYESDVEVVEDDGVEIVCERCFSFFTVVVLDPPVKGDGREAGVVGKRI